MLVTIIKCSTNFFWYERFAVFNSTKPNILDYLHTEHARTFEVNDYDGTHYSTVEDVAGPNMKGFINKADCILKE